MTRQEIFDKVAEHLLTQKCQARVRRRNSYGFESLCCALRGENGTKCSIGALIKDEHYNVDLEYEPISSTRFGESLRLSGVFSSNSLLTNDVEFLRYLRILHDFEQPSRWKDCLKRFAEQHELEWKFEQT